jgi:alpha-mannosidase
MLPKHHLHQLIPRRLASALERLRACIWSDLADIPCVFESEGRTRAEARRRDVSATPPFHWGRLFGFGRFRLMVDPAACAGKPVYLNWQDQAEGTLYVDGVPYFGFDVAHRECLLPDDFRELVMESCCLQSAIWHPAATGLDPMGSRFEGARLLLRDDLAWEVYHDFIVLYELVEQWCLADNPRAAEWWRHSGTMPQADMLCHPTRLLLRRLDEAVDAWERDGLPEMKSILADIYQTFTGSGPSIRAVATGHAHIDLVWLWPERVGELKAVHTFSTVNYLMERYGEFRFGYSQPASYEAVSRLEPELMDTVRERIRAGRWEAVGAMYVEADNLLPCGEVLARCLTIGQAEFQSLQGSLSPLLWLPDVFGFSVCLPQVMKLAGADYFFTSKQGWNDTVPFPFTSFVWRGNDGSEVLGHVGTEWVNYYNGRASVREIGDAQMKHVQSDVHPEVLVPTGFGDGGGGPTAEACERIRRMENLANLPRTQWGGLVDFFRRMETSAGDLPRHHGEIFPQYHRGVFSSNGRLKRRYRQVEMALQAAEAAACVTGAAAVPEAWWKRAIFPLFHDYLPGSSIADVYAEGMAELDGLLQNANELTLRNLTGEGGEDCVFNPTPIERVVPLGDGFVRLPPLRGVAVRDLVPAEGEVSAADMVLDNGRVRALFNKSGEIESISIDGHEIPLKGPAGQLHLYPDQPHEFEAWEKMRQSYSLGRQVNGSAKAIYGPNFIRFERKLSNRSRANVTYSLLPGCGQLQIAFEVDWQDPQTMVKFIVPTWYAGKQARYGAAFTSVLRSQLPEDLSDEAQFEVPASRYAVVSDDCERDGLFIAAEGLFGFTCREGVLATTLLTSPRVTGEGGSYESLLPKALRDTHYDSPFADIGLHRIRLCIGRVHLDMPRDEHPAAIADHSFVPVFHYRGAEVASPLAGIEGLPSLVPGWLTRCKDGVPLLRLHETCGRRGRAAIPGAKAAVDFLHRPMDKEIGSDGGFDVRPYEIVSLKLG